ncbi:type VI secretion system baseplate subunit TssF [Cronobacter sakazakii]|uniref:type VI secretion system baseplate subunit TssF n=1 Tax=Cronobacter sakazakii TaxID=28141 RepID=UPI000DA1EF31|nr:type VI secretion system baseplate subunit TssF [Cronobacter sakazakii]ELY3416700.1 type VI secretion system baseplate subunit TssF [Cronobacter sakazakii]ELY4337077.1 type VI secretion system baseplate subunit TssF [Cronobacter sakazakii]NCH42921.1 type VI secretion system baseplate subunit TssF [Cronobacter sakazakii]HAU5470857.1 type VI secretion system baseplate subunit TssF [Cronobacter sakazakii]
MDNKFLDYYNKELTYMREMAQEFALQHPKIAARLGMHGIEIADPYVERLIEAFCFMSARVQIKLDAGFPQFTQRLLDIIYPNYTSPVPSMGVVQLKPDFKEGDLTHGYTVARHSAFYSPIAPGEATRCEFRNGHAVTLWPLEITEARLTSLPPDIPSTAKFVLPVQRLKGALRIKLKLHENLRFSQLAGLEQLPVYIDGDERVVSHIFELIHTAHVAMMIHGKTSGGNVDTLVTEMPLTFEGLNPEQSLLPAQWNIFHGHTLLQEYFTCRQRFYFFTLTQLSEGLKKIDSNEAEIIILLDNAPQDLVAHITAARFLLFCTPVINLFPKQMDRIEINRALNEFHVVADRSRPLDYEIFSISKVAGQQAESSNEVTFSPLFQTRHYHHGNAGRYFSHTRRPRTLDKNVRHYETRTSYRGTEVFISLVDQHEAPFSDDLRYLSVDALVTNRDLPVLLSRSGHFDLIMTDAAPVESARFVCAPSFPHSPFAEGEYAWRLIRQLSFNYQPLADMDHSTGGEALRKMLRLFISHSDREASTQIDALVGCKSEPIVRRLPDDGLLIYGRGVRCTLTVDEAGFSGISPYLFGLIMENYIARHAAINVFTETELVSMQRGRISRWKARPGRRGVL